MQPTGTAKLPAFFFRFQTKEWVLRFNKDINDEETLNGVHSWFKGNNGLSKSKKFLF